jgi:hypothetical protein
MHAGKVLLNCNVLSKKETAFNNYCYCEHDMSDHLMLKEWKLSSPKSKKFEVTLHMCCCLRTWPMITQLMQRHIMLDTCPDGKRFKENDWVPVVTMPFSFTVKPSHTVHGKRPAGD